MGTSKWIMHTLSAHILTNGRHEKRGKGG